MKARILFICLTLIGLQQAGAQVNNLGVIQSFESQNSISPTSKSNSLALQDVNSEPSLLPAGNQHLPYPVIFIHGLNSSSRAWFDHINELSSQGLTFGGEYHVCLNTDGNYSISNKIENPIENSGADISYWINVPYSDFYAPADYYVVNFNIDNNGKRGSSFHFPNDFTQDAGFTDVLSNESAIVKQGVALREIIRRVLLLTGRDKVVLMGHSMGGLAAREYVQNTSNWQLDGQHHVAKLVTTGTPHGGFEGINFSILTDIDEESEAYRDLKSDYWISGAEGVYLFGGYETYSVMNNNGLSYYDFYNVDVNCNGYDNDGSYVIGLNERLWQTNLDYAYIIGECANAPCWVLQGAIIGDGIVRSVNANLSNFTNQLPPQYNEFLYSADASTSKGLHSDLPEAVMENMKGLDEPNEYELSYGIDFNVEYTGFISRPSVHGYDYDYDDFVFELPVAASIDLTTYSNFGYNIPFSILNAQLAVVYSGILSPNSSGSFFTQELAAGTYYIEFYVHEGYITDNSYLYPYTFELDIAPVVSMFTASSNTICAGECISFTDNTSNSPNSWSWSFPGANTTVSNAQNPNNICYNTPGTYNVSLTTSNGFSSDNTTLTGLITVLPNPVPVISQNGNTLTSSISSGNQWYNGSNLISGATGSSYTPTTSGVFSVLVTNSNGCTRTSNTFNFVFTALPVASFNSNLSEICDGECVVFSDNSSNNPTSWLWTFQGGTPSTSSAQFPGSICYQTPGTYNVTLTVTNTGGDDVLISYDHITVNPLPGIPTISVNGNTLTSSANSGNQWHFNGSPLNGFNTPSIQVTQSGNYYVIVTNSLGCTETSNVFPFTATEIIENSTSDNFSLYPNPTTGLVRLNTDGKVERIEVFNLSGQLLLVTSDLNFDLSEYSDGIYLVRIHCNKEISNFKLIKAN